MLYIQLGVLGRYHLEVQMTQWLDVSMEQLDLFEDWMKKEENSVLGTLDAKIMIEPVYCFRLLNCKA